jgi:hypothetical protein
LICRLMAAWVTQRRHLREQPVGEQLFLLHGFHL